MGYGEDLSGLPLALQNAGGDADFDVAGALLGQ
jgi:hypothetical protein